MAAQLAPDVVDLLTDQHAAIRRGFRRALVPGPYRARAFRDLVRLLAVHEGAEEAHVHPTLRHRRGFGKPAIAMRLAEEKHAKKLLKETARIGPGGDGFGRALRRLRTAVLAHAAREERQEFPALRTAVHRPRRRALGAEVRLTQAIAPTRPHPLVNSQLANKLAVPVAGPLDRGRDLLGRAVGRH